MVLENKLGIISSAELSEAEERLTKSRAAEIFTDQLLGDKVPGAFSALAFMQGIDASYAYEGYEAFVTEELAQGA